MSSAKNPNPKDVAAASETRLDISLFPGTALAAGALAMTEGAKKYGAYNWRETPVKASVYISAAFRHLMKYHNGEKYDIYTGVPHLASVMANAAILIDAEQCGTLIDDLPVPAPIPWDRFQRIASDLPPSNTRSYYDLPVMYTSSDDERRHCRREGEPDRRKVRIPTYHCRRTSRSGHFDPEKVTRGRRVTDVVSYMDLPGRGV